MSAVGSWRGRLMVGGMLLGATALQAQQTVELPARDREVDPAVEEVYRVGSLDGEAWETFGEVSQVGFDNAGNLYVLDRQNSRVVVVDRRGGLVREFGKEGDGPGEWRLPGAMAVMPDGRVVISDGGHRAYMVFGPDGDFSHAVSMAQEGGMIALGTLLPDPRGDAVFDAAGGAFSVRMSAGGGAIERPEGRPVDRVTLGEGGSRSLFYSGWRPPPVEGSGEGPRMSFGGGGRGFAMATGAPFFEPRLHVATLPGGGLAVVDSSTWTVKVVGPDGRERSRVVRDIEPVRVTERIRERERERRLAELEAGEGPQMRVMVRGADGGATALDQEQIKDMQRQQLEARGFYPEIPVVARIASTPSGTIWLERSTVNPDDEGPIDVFRADGTYLGTIAADGVRIPAAFGPDGLAAWIERDELDVPTIVVRRVGEAVR